MKQLLGKTIFKIERKDDAIIFYVMADYHFQKFMLYHQEDCCENVYIDDISGDFDDLLSSPVLISEESNSQREAEYGNSETWSFYRIATNKGFVVIRFYGTSNGYYSETACLELVQQASYYEALFYTN